ncbi:MAG: hypothetical protein AAF614_02715 [Chloroflexota bacterium]
MAGEIEKVKAAKNAVSVLKEGVRVADDFSKIVGKGVETGDEIAKVAGEAFSALKCLGPAGAVLGAVGPIMDLVMTLLGQDGTSKILKAIQGISDQMNNFETHMENEITSAKTELETYISTSILTGYQGNINAAYEDMKKYNVALENKDTPSQSIQKNLMNYKPTRYLEIFNALCDKVSAPPETIGTTASSYMEALYINGYGDYTQINAAAVYIANMAHQCATLYSFLKTFQYTHTLIKSTDSTPSKVEQIAFKCDKTKKDTSDRSIPCDKQKEDWETSFKTGKKDILVNSYNEFTKMTTLTDNLSQWVDKTITGFQTNYSKWVDAQLTGIQGTALLDDSSTINTLIPPRSKWPWNDFGAVAIAYWDRGSGYLAPSLDAGNESSTGIDSLGSIWIKKKKVGSDEAHVGVCWARVVQSEFEKLPAACQAKLGTIPFIGNKPAYPDDYAQPLSFDTAKFPVSEELANFAHFTGNPMHWVIWYTDSASARWQAATGDKTGNRANLLKTTVTWNIGPSTGAHRTENIAAYVFNC